VNDIEKIRGENISNPAGKTFPNKSKIRKWYLLIIILAFFSTAFLVISYLLFGNQTLVTITYLFRHTFIVIWFVISIYTLLELKRLQELKYYGYYLFCL